MTIKFTKDHEWISVDGDVATIGITDHAQSQLGDVVFVELPENGRKVAAHEACAVVESVKAASDVYAPLAGRITEFNETVVDEPALVNRAAGDEAWFFRMELADGAAFEELMDQDAYDALLETL